MRSQCATKFKIKREKEEAEFVNNFVLTVSALSYESLPPNFSLLQNMAAGAFAGIAVSD